MIIKIISLGLPNFTMQIVSSMLNAILNANLLRYGGDIAVSGMGVVNSLQTILLMPIIGLNQGVQPIISFNFGAHNHERVKATAKLAIAVATTIVTIGFIITRLFPEQMIMLFNKEPQLVEFSKHALLSWFLFLPILGFQIIASNFFQAIGRPKSAMFLTLTRQLILLIPAIIIFPKFWGLKGLLFSAPFADLLSTVITGIWFYYGIKNLNTPILSIGYE